MRNKNNVIITESFCRLIICVEGSSETQAVTRLARHVSNARREVEGEDKREFCVRRSE